MNHSSKAIQRDLNQDDLIVIAGAGGFIGGSLALFAWRAPTSTRQARCGARASLRPPLKRGRWSARWPRVIRILPMAWPLPVGTRSGARFA